MFPYRAPTHSYGPGTLLSQRWKKRNINTEEIVSFLKFFIYNFSLEYIFCPSGILITIEMPNITNFINICQGYGALLMKMT